jgi:acyl dehydratase
MSAGSGQRWPIGKKYDCGSILVDPKAAGAYAAATNDHNTAYEGKDAIVPPMFHVWLMWDMLSTFIQDPELALDLSRLVHGEHDASFLHPIHPGETLQLQASLEQVADKSSGLLVVGRFQCLRAGLLVVDCRSSFFIRTASNSSKPRDEKALAQRMAKRAARGLPEADLEQNWRVDPDQSARYADASRDRNPIHLDPEFAKSVGLGDVILHGLCTMAMSGRSLVELAGNGDPRTLGRLSVRFSKPVRNGSTLSTRAWRTERGLKFTILDENGEAVITHGLAELATEPS